MGSFSIKNICLISLSQMGMLTTMPAGLVCASISVHAVKEEESKKQLVKPEQVTCLQKFVNYVTSMMQRLWGFFFCYLYSWKMPLKYLLGTFYKLRGIVIRCLKISTVFYLTQTYKILSLVKINWWVFLRIIIESYRVLVLLSSLIFLSWKMYIGTPEIWKPYFNNFIKVSVLKVTIDVCWVNLLLWYYTLLYSRHTKWLFIFYINKILN